MSDLPRLIERCRTGDASAWEEVVRAHTGRIYTLCYRFTGRAEDAQDVTQEVFVKAYRRLGQYDPAQSALATWLTAIARHALVDFFRRSRNDRRTDSLDGVDPREEGAARPIDLLEDDAPGPDASLAARDAQRLVQAALGQLSPEYREVVILRDLQDMDYSEIAAAVGVPEGTVKSRISRGRAELARILARIYEQVPTR